MDLIYTNSERVDEGVLSAYAFDLSFGEKENNFEITLGFHEGVLEPGAFIYVDGTEYGGIVDGMKTNSDDEAIVYSGRTWHGILNSKVVEPDSGQNYYTVSGDANVILTSLIARMGLQSLFTVLENLSGITIPTYQFKRYCSLYDGIRDMLNTFNAKLVVKWQTRKILLYAVSIVDYSNEPVDSDVATLSVEQYKGKVNHLICLGRGELSEREVIHLYVNQNGEIVNNQYYTGAEEITEIYDYSNVESSEELRKGGVKRLKERMNIDKAEITISETQNLYYDIGDIVSASDIKTGISGGAVVTQKIVKIKNGAIRTEYKTGG